VYWYMQHVRGFTTMCYINWCLLTYLLSLFLVPSYPQKDWLSWKSTVKASIVTLTAAQVIQYSTYSQLDFQHNWGTRSEEWTWSINFSHVRSPASTLYRRSATATCIQQRTCNRVKWSIWRGCLTLYRAEVSTSYTLPSRSNLHF